MKIIEQGDPPPPVKMIGTCKYCGTKVECERRETFRETVYLVCLLFLPVRRHTLACPSCDDIIKLKRKPPPQQPGTGGGPP